MTATQRKCKPKSRSKDDYPKTFKFEGWHPQCFCFVTPILVDEDEMAKMTEAALNGEEYKPQGEAVYDYPAAYKEWVKDNADTIEQRWSEGKINPYFIEHNKSVYKRIVSGYDFEKDKPIGDESLYDKGVPGNKPNVIHEQYVKITRKEIVETLHELSMAAANEEAYIVFPDGKVLHRWCDSANSVSMRGLDLTEATIYHNHPSNEGINWKDIIVAYKRGAHSIAAICPNYKDEVIFKKGKRTFEGTADSIMTELEDRAKRKLDSKEYDALLQGGIYAWSKFMCKEMEATYRRIGFQKQ